MCLVLTLFLSLKSGLKGVRAGGSYSSILLRWIHFLMPPSLSCVYGGTGKPWQIYLRRTRLDPVSALGRLRRVEDTF